MSSPKRPTLDKKFPHDIDVVVDRIVVRPDIGQRLAESFETALKLAEGLAVIEFADAPAGAAEEKKSDKKTAKIHDKSGPERILFSEKFACPVSGFTIPEIEPRLFSFNNPYGACPACGGLGVEQHIDADLVIPDKERPCARARSRRGRNRPRPITSRRCSARQVLQVHARHQVEGPAEEDAGMHPARLRRRRDQVLLRGRRALLRHQEAVRGRHHQSRAPLPRDRERMGARGAGKIFLRHALRGCNGYRLKPEALCVKIGGKHIGEISELSVLRAGEWFETVPKALNAQQNEIAARVLKEIRERLSLPARCRPELSHARARLRHAVRRRKPAHPPRLADRLGPDRRALRAGRAVDRPAPARQRAAAGDAEAAARPRQHRDRRRA